MVGGVWIGQLLDQQDFTKTGSMPIGQLQEGFGTEKNSFPERSDRSVSISSGWDSYFLLGFLNRENVVQIPN